MLHIKVTYVDVCNRNNWVHGYWTSLGGGFINSCFDCLLIPLLEFLVWNILVCIPGLVTCRPVILHSWENKHNLSLTHWLRPRSVIECGAICLLDKDMWSRFPIIQIRWHYLYNVEFTPWNTVFLLRRGPGVILATYTNVLCIQTVVNSAEYVGRVK